MNDGSVQKLLTLSQSLLDGNEQPAIREDESIIIQIYIKDLILMYVIKNLVWWSKMKSLMTINVLLTYEEFPSRNFTDFGSLQFCIVEALG